MDKTDIKEKARYAFVREKAKNIRTKPLPKAMTPKQAQAIREITEEKNEDTEPPTPAERMLRLGQETARQAVYRGKEMRFTVKRISDRQTPREAMRRETIRKQQEKAISIKEKPAEFSAGKMDAGVVRPKLAAKKQTGQSVVKQPGDPKLSRKMALQKTARVKQVTNGAKRSAQRAATFSRKVVQAISKGIAAAGSTVVWVAAISILLGVMFLCVVGAVLGSPLGIVTGGGADGTPTITEVIQRMDQELANKISYIQTSSGELDETHLSYNGTDSYSYIQNMADIVAVFAVKAGLNETAPMDVLTMDAKRIRIFREVFWDMVSVSSLLTETVVEGEELDVNDVPIPVTMRRLDVRIDTKGWQDMLPSLNLQQQEMLTLLMEEPIFSMIQAMCGSNSMLTLTPEQIDEMESYLPEDLDPMRRRIVETAWSLVGKIGYFWGGKSEVIGWDTRWGVPTIVTSTGNDAYGTVQPFGLDCSRFVTWMMINATEDTNAVNYIGHGTSNQWGNTTPISWGEAQPGDLVFVSPGWAADNHVGIVVGRNATGRLMVCHCTGGGVVVTTAGQFNYVRGVNVAWSSIRYSKP